MTDKEIKIGLACCAYNGYACDECPIHKAGYDCEDLSVFSLRLIKRLEKENVKLKNALKEKKEGAK